MAEQLESGEREEKNDQKVEEEKREGGEAVECPDTVDLTLEEDDDDDDEGVSG